MAGPCLKQEPVLALPIFPGRRQPSIVSRNELNYRVRNGNGWTLALISTNLLVADFVSLTSAFRPKLTLSVPPRLPRQTLRWFGSGDEILRVFMLSGLAGEQTVLYCIRFPLSSPFSFDPKLASPGFPSKPSAAGSMGQAKNYRPG